jgi:hypothetical protein
MILSGTILGVLVVLVGVNTVMALPNAGVGGNDVPQVYLLKKAFDICSPEGTIPGGSTPESGITGEGEVQSGCVNFLGERANEYLFAGEQMAILVAARDLNGAPDLERAELWVDGEYRVTCNELTLADLDDGAPGPCQKEHGEYVHCIWFGHLVNDDLNDQPPAKAAMQDENGFDGTVDKIYQCVFSPNANDASPETGSLVTVKVYDELAASGDDMPGESLPNSVWLNPAITLDIYVEPGDVLEFPAGVLGQTVYAMNTLNIKNTADGGVDLYAWLAMTDFRASSGPAKCPLGNWIDVETQVGYRCKIGTLFNNEWNLVHNPDDTKVCKVDTKDYDSSRCQGATPLLANHQMFSIIANQHTAECWFRFTYPENECKGTFDLGGEVIVYARAI